MTSTAGGGTLTLEFGILSRLTKDPGNCLVCMINNFKNAENSIHWEENLALI